MDKSRTEFFSGRIAECTGDQKKLFNEIKTLMKPTEITSYPDHESLLDLADSFGDFFVQKIQRIRKELDDLNVEPIELPVVVLSQEQKMKSFTILSEEKVAKLI